MASNELVETGRATRITFENARIVFRNFSGKEGQYNREGDRNFALIIDNEIAQQMLDDGWNVKFLRPREIEDEPQAYLQIAVSYKVRPPRVVMIAERRRNGVTEQVRTDIPEDLLSVLDWVDIANVDLIITPYRWGPINGREGIKAYLYSIYITIVQDELEQKYADVPESAQNILESTGTLAIEAGEDPNIIDAEIVEDDD